MTKKSFADVTSLNVKCYSYALKSVYLQSKQLSDWHLLSFSSPTIFSLVWILQFLSFFS